MPNLTLFDETSQNTYILQVTKEELKKANKDALFATRLLQEKLNTSQTVTDNEPVATTSSCDDTSTSSCNVHGTDSEKAQELSQDLEEKDSFRWPQEAILFLLTIYKEHEDKMTSGKMSVKKFWNMVSCLLIEKGHHVTGTQCKSKMAGLKNTYKSVKDHNAKSGNNTRTWRYFNVMDEIFHKKPWVAPLSTIDSGNPHPISSEEDDIENSIPSSTKPKLPIKRKRQTVLEKMLEENTIARKKMHEEAMTRQDKLLDILSKVLQK